MGQNDGRVATRPRACDTFEVVDRLRTFLRYGQLVIELGARPLLVGRSGTCDIVLDDELASREHCKIELLGENALLTDFESRNGVLVNGVKVDRTQELHHGDCITIGRQQLLLARLRRAPSMTPPTGEQRLRFDSDGPEATRQGDIFTILHGAALSSMASRDLLTAEASARNLFVAIRGATARGRILPDGVLPAAVDLGLALAEQSGEATWLDQVLEVLVATREPLSENVARRFATLAERVGTPARMRDEYVKMAREVGGPNEPSARILVRL